jgi:cysteinyl-tRNA synthetase|tara:strand:- start:2605 stop:4023 length:1419 start_codon:yes stop_codon:yes gene_type:complete
MSHAELVFHNTLSGKKETFVPADPGHVTVYVCGPTVYNLVHIGNGRPAVVFDVLIRLLRTRYPRVTYVSNITDIDDKINAAAAENGEDIATLAERFALAYQEDISALGVRPPDVVPKATHHIAEIVDMIDTLIGKGHAYASEGHVLFHVPSDPEYGSLAKRSLEDMIDGARVEVADYKKDPKDFVLWKPSTADQPGWDSPWGRGRPGWHIECSAMVKKHLGDTIDIHGGGSDLTFPHHENEAAQSRCANDHPTYVRYWLHNGMLNLGTEKMSKSLGNVLTIRALLEKHSSEVLRYALLSGQYRSSLTWSDELLAQARASLDGLYQSLRDADDSSSLTSRDMQGLAFPDYPNAVVAALCDDLNTPKALAAMHELANQVRRASDSEAKKYAVNQLLAGGWLLGLLVHTPENYFTQGQPGAEDSLSAEAIEQLLEQRKAARANGDYAGADRIRDDLLAAGIELEDSREGTRWRKL